jgi:hypothetical protein
MTAPISLLQNAALPHSSAPSEPKWLTHLTFIKPIPA